MNIKFRQANIDDCEQLFVWANDECVRRNSFNSNAIKYEDHKVWFLESLENATIKIFMVSDGEENIGSIKLHIRDNLGVLGYSVCSDYRGKGYGTEILKKIVDMVKAQSLLIDKLIGKVKHDNIPSQKAFEKAGYSKEVRSEYIEYTKLIIDRD